MNDIKQQVISELDRRMELLEKHLNDEIEATGNQYVELNKAISKVIGGSLKKELGSVKLYVESL